MRGVLNHSTAVPHAHSSVLSMVARNPLLPLDSVSDRSDGNLFEIPYQIHRGFTTDEEMLIKNALVIIANRLCNVDILENMYRICGTTGCLFGAGVWARSQLAKEEVYQGIHNLLRFQLTCLRELGERDQFPLMHIYPIYEKSNTQAEGTIGCVLCIFLGSTFCTQGQFQVKLNRYNLNASNEDASSSLYWAAAIVHEMLHNLGHQHRIDDYSNQWQINVFERCFLHDGNYAP